MPAYLLCEARSSDAKAYAGYRQQLERAVRGHGGRILAWDGRMEVLEGGWQAPQSLAMLEFSDLAAIHRFFASPEYRQVQDARLGAVKTQVLAVEGF